MPGPMSFKNILIHIKAGIYPAAGVALSPISPSPFHVENPARGGGERGNRGRGLKSTHIHIDLICLA